MDDTPKYFGVHSPPNAVDPIAYDAMVSTLVAHANRIRYTAQSILTGLLTKPDLPTLEQARDIVAWANRMPPK